MYHIDRLEHLNKEMKRLNDELNETKNQLKKLKESGVPQSELNYLIEKIDRIL